MLGNRRVLITCPKRNHTEKCQEQNILWNIISYRKSDCDSALRKLFIVKVPFITSIQAEAGLRLALYIFIFYFDSWAELIELDCLNGVSILEAFYSALEVANTYVECNGTVLMLTNLTLENVRNRESLLLSQSLKAHTNAWLGC